jgi:RNA polymerase subunit RPABC4/transcription elongation factor Spt4
MTKVLVCLEKIGGYGGKKVLAYLVSGWSTKHEKTLTGNNIFLSEKNTFAVKDNTIIDEVLEILKQNIKIKDRTHFHEKNRVWMEWDDFLVIIEIQKGMISSVTPIKIKDLPMSKDKTNQITHVSIMESYIG